MGQGSDFSKRATPLLWAGSRATRGRIKISSIPKCLHYCLIFTVYTPFTHMTRGPRVGNHGLTPLQT
jgi:hypothetical protein